MIAVVLLTIIELAGMLQDKIEASRFHDEADHYAECSTPETPELIACHGYSETDRDLGPINVIWHCEDGFRAVLNQSDNICKYRNEPIIN